MSWKGESKVILKDAVAARDAITTQQYAKISNLYEDWAKEIGEQAKFYDKQGGSYFLSARQHEQLSKSLTEQSHVVSNQVYQTAKDSIYLVSDAVVKSCADWAASMGFGNAGLSAAFSSVPQWTVNQLVTGQIYEGGWNLSAAIWGNNEKELQNIYQIVAGGLAQNQPVYQTAKQLEQYVSPSAAKQWNLVSADGRKIYPRSVDYSSQRLVRTLTQHGYQSSLVAMSKTNPFISGFIWHAIGSRACPMCTDLDGLYFDKGKLPLDHPNGMCEFEPSIDPDYIDKLADWVTADNGVYPEIDNYAVSLGYSLPQKANMQFAVQAKSVMDSALSSHTVYSNFIGALDEYMGLGGKGAGSYVDNVVKNIAKGKKYGGDSQAVFTAFKNGSATGAQTKQILKALESSQKQIAKVLENESKGVKNYAKIAQEKAAAEAKAKAEAAKKAFEKAKADFPHTLGKNGAGSQSKSWQTWFNKLSAEEKKVVTALKDESGKGWITWYQENVYTGNSYVSGTKAAKQANVAKKAPQQAYKVDKSDVKKVFGEYHSTTSPLYSNVEKALGGDGLSDFKAVVHEIKESTGKTYHIDVWNDYLAGKLTPEQSAKIEAVFEKHATKYEKAVSDANKSAKMASIGNAGSSAKTYDEAWATIRDINEQKGVSIADSTTWIDGCKTNTTSNQLAMEDDRLLKGFTRSEHDSIRFYTGSGYDDINGAMRSIPKSDIEPIRKAVEANDRAAFDSVMQRNGIRSNIQEHIWNNVKAFQKTVIEETTYVRRGTSISEIGGLFADGADYFARADVVRGMSAEEMNVMFFGKVGVYDSLVSTSAMWDKGFSKSCEIVFCVPEGSEGASVMRISHYDTGEGETILNYGTRVKFIRAEKSDGHKSSSLRVFLEVIPPK